MGKTHNKKAADEAALASLTNATRDTETGFQGYEPAGVLTWQPQKSRKARSEAFECPIHLKYPGAHSTWGLLMRVAAKVVAYNVGMMINRLLGRPDFAFATLIV